MKHLFKLLVWLRRKSIAREERKSARELKRKVMKTMIYRKADNSPYIFRCTSRSEREAKEILERMGIRYTMMKSGDGTLYFKEIKDEQED